MKIKSAEYISSGVKPEQYPTNGLPEVAFVGRSNVGKSSLINALINRRSLARTSSQPGKTQTLNFYLVNDVFYFVDLPGYGYAKVSQSERTRFRRMMYDYLERRNPLVLSIQLIDFRHPPSALDQEMFAHLQKLHTPFLVVANKIDKVPKSKWEVNRRSIFSSLPGLRPESLLLFSAETKQGIEDLRRGISVFLPL